MYYSIENILTFCPLTGTLSSIEIERNNILEYYYLSYSSRKVYSEDIYLSLPPLRGHQRWGAILSPYIYYYIYIYISPLYIIYSGEYLIKTYCNI